MLYDWKSFGMKRGVTLVELLVVASIVGTLLGIMLPAVNMARESSRNTERLNWRRQRVLDSPPHRKTPFRILFVGNSHTFFNDIPGLLSEMSKIQGSTEVITESVVEGGKGLKYHYDTGVAAERMASEKYDFVVLQDHAQQPCVDENAFIEYNVKLSKIAKDHGAIPLVYMLFERKKDCPEGYCPQETLTSSSRRALKCIQGGDGAGDISPVGEAWRAFSVRRPDLELHQSDGYHSNEAGAYLTACVFYSVIHRSSPAGLPASLSTPLANVAVLKKDARLMQETAWEISERWRSKTKAWFLK